MKWYGDALPPSYRRGAVLVPNATCPYDYGTVIVLENSEGVVILADPGPECYEIVVLGVRGDRLQVYGLNPQRVDNWFAPATTWVPIDAVSNCETARRMSVQEFVALLATATYN